MDGGIDLTDPNLGIGGEMVHRINILHRVLRHRQPRQVTSDKLKTTATEPPFNIISATGAEIIHDADNVPLSHQPVDQMRADEASAAGH
jgi:hypothetical protein